MTTPGAGHQPTTPPHPADPPHAVARPRPADQPPPGAHPAPYWPSPPPTPDRPSPPPPITGTTTAGPSRKPIVVLTASAAVFALAAGLFTVLYLGERGDRDSAAATRADREHTLADLRDRQDELDRALETNKSRQSALSDENDLLVTCVEAARAYFDLPIGESPQSSQLFGVMYDVCPKI